MFLKEPGYINDLFFLFLLYFNSEYCLANMVNGNQSAEDIEFYHNILREYNDISDDLYPFFFITEVGQCFMTECYFEPNKEVFATTSFNLSSLQSNLSNYDDVTANLLRYYFRELDEKMVGDCLNSTTVLSQVVKESKYSYQVKTLLLTFFINPVPVIQKLSYELMIMEHRLAQEYEKKYMSLIKMRDEFDTETLVEQLKLCKTASCDLQGFSKIYVSPCIMNKNCVKVFYLPDTVILLLGTDYQAAIEYCKTRNSCPDLDVVGNALAEKNRIEILELAYRKKEITIKDIEQELRMTGTNAYYHLSTFIRANIFQTRNRGRTVLYRINKECFKTVCEALSKYAN